MKSLDARPEVWFENIEAMDAFFKLSSRRQPGFSDISRISFGEILSYCQIYRINDIEELAEKIVAADEAFIAHIKQKEAKAQ